MSGRRTGPPRRERQAANDAFFGHMTKDEQERAKADRLAAALRANLRRRKQPAPELQPPREDDA